MENFIGKVEFRGIEKGIGKSNGKEWVKIKFLIDDKPVDEFDKNDTLSVLLAENNVKVGQVINAIFKPYVNYNKDTRNFELRNKVVGFEF